MTEYTGIIDRLEKATGLDRDLDIAIARACPFDGWRVEHDGSVSAFDGEGWYSAPTEVPMYTHSIDAALTLVPDDWTAWEIRSMGRKTIFSCDLSRMTECDANAGQDWAYGNGHNPAIALCIAALKARAAGERP